MLAISPPDMATRTRSGRILDQAPGAGGDAGAGRLRVADHPERGLAPPRRAHLREEVEVVLEDPDHPRAHRREQRGELRLPLGEHRVEEGDRDAAPPKHRRRQERGERGVRLHLPRLLRVVTQEVGMREEDGGFAQEARGV